jgi:hypothetical protein
MGVTVTRHDSLLALIPENYEQSPYLPRVYDHTVQRVRDFAAHVERVSDRPGAFVECGVSIGYGLLLWMLLTEAIGPKRRYYGFDSFQGFPAPTVEDGRSAAAVLTHGYYATPEDLVWRVLQDGRVPDDARARLTLVRGFFEQTVPSFSEPIALLHLDCDLYESYRTCLVHLYDRVVPGGVIVFDDYGHPRWPGAQRAVDEFLADKREKVITGSTCYLVKA